MPWKEVSNAGIAAATGIYSKDPNQAASVWLGVESVSKRA